MFNHDEWILEQQNPMISLKKWQTTVDLMARLYEAPTAYVSQYTSRGFQTVIANSNPANPYKAGDSFARDTNLFCRKVVQDCAQVYENHATSNPVWRGNPMMENNRFNSYLGVPIYWPDGTPFGTICVLDYAVTHYNKNFLELIWQFRDLVEADLMLNNQFMQLLELSTRDDLSRLLNRRGFFSQADKQVRLASRVKQNIGVLYLDLDNLKKINDQMGHRIGDKAIAALAAAIRKVIRESDVAGRIGGDEFVIVMLAEDEESLAKLTYRIRQELKQQAVGELQSIELSVSIGSRLFRHPHLSSIDKMVSEVDQRMYEDKLNNHRSLGKKA
ncbi:MAG: sensor domain-containing diguanylate cyclase [Gammaproteobacteria bacterium]|nr:sensor domain-containing diguanylate cyclase [Gammaproteobacteria bacterium]